MRTLLDRYRHSLTNYDSALAYALLGIVGGVASGLLVLAFELAIGQLGGLWGIAGGEDFESLPRWLQFGLPVAGAIILGLAFSLLQPEDRETGIVHVLSRMHSHYGALPLRNMLVQFFGGAFALATGQSGGREGPGVHLGGAVNSLFGQRLGLPNNSLRVLIACGAAGGIAAAFDTPLAGVIFAMEVIVAEYTVAGFVPVMLSAVSASAISRNLGGGAALLAIPEVQLNSLWEIPYIILLGVCCGMAIALFIRLSKLSARLSHWPVAVRFLLAGVFTGAIALMVPEVLGMGYDTLDRVLQSELTLTLLLAIAGAKLAATSFSSGMGMPIGVIGPSLLIGACLGGALGQVGATFFPEFASDQTLYIVIGMAAAMGVVLNAPLAAILAVLELTQTISVAMPALLAIVAANLTNTGIFRQRSAHQTVLRQLQRAVPQDPLNQMLHRTDVTSQMDPNVVRISALLESSAAKSIIDGNPIWCVLTRETQDLYLVSGAELVDWLQERPAEEEQADITEAPIRRWTIASVPEQATLRQAMDTIRADTVEAVSVYGRAPGGNRVLRGIVTRESIEKFSLARL